MTYDFNLYNGTSLENTERRVHSARQKSNYQLPGSPYTEVSLKAKTYTPTDRIRALSAPKKRIEFHIRTGV